MRNRTYEKQSIWQTEHMRNRTYEKQNIWETEHMGGPPCLLLPSWRLLGSFVVTLKHAAESYPSSWSKESELSGKESALWHLLLCLLFLLFFLSSFLSWFVRILSKSQITKTLDREIPLDREIRVRSVKLQNSRSRVFIFLCAFGKTPKLSIESFHFFVRVRWLPKKFHSIE